MCRAGSPGGAAGAQESVFPHVTPPLRLVPASRWAAAADGTFLHTELAVSLPSAPRAAGTESCSCARTARIRPRACAGWRSLWLREFDACVRCRRVLPCRSSPVLSSNPCMRDTWPLRSQKSAQACPRRTCWRPSTPRLLGNRTPCSFSQLCGLLNPQLCGLLKWNCRHPVPFVASN